MSLRYIGVDRSDRYLFILLEFVPGGSISSLLGQYGPFSEELLRYTLAAGLAASHSSAN